MMKTPELNTEMPVLDCEGFRKLAAAMERDVARGDTYHDYRAKVRWAVERARHYAEKTGLTPEAVLDEWEMSRSYWYMNFYQEANQPIITADRVRVFDNQAALLKSVKGAGFRCPMCGGVSRSPYECDAGGKLDDGRVCDWKVYGLFGHLGKGITVFVKDQVRMESIFMPVAWE